MPSPTVKKSISKSEEIKKYFSICNRYIQIKIIAGLLKWFFIFLAISVVLFFADQVQIFAVPETQKATEEYSDIISKSETGQGLLSMMNANTADVSQQIFNIWAILALVFLLIITPAIIFYNLFYLKISNEFVLTNRRIIIKRGWISTKVKSIHYNKITDISISQSLFDKIIKTGILSISTAGSDGYKAVLNHIPRPYKIKNLLYNLKTVTQKFKIEEENEENEEE
jgi:membrane protein YdbS with pleckstrin-like domain